MASPPRKTILDNSSLLVSALPLLTLKRVQPSTVEKRFRRFRFLAQHERGKLKLLSDRELNALHQMPPDIPESRDIGIDKNGTVEILHNWQWKAILLALADDELMRVLINILDAPALDAQMMMHQLYWRLVLLKRNLNDFKGLPKTSNKRAI